MGSIYTVQRNRPQETMQEITDSGRRRRQRATSGGGLLMWPKAERVSLRCRSGGATRPRYNTASKIGQVAQFIRVTSSDSDCNTTNQRTADNSLSAVWLLFTSTLLSFVFDAALNTAEILRRGMSSACDLHCLQGTANLR